MSVCINPSYIPDRNSIGGKGQKYSCFFHYPSGLGQFANMNRLHLI